MNDATFVAMLGERERESVKKKKIIYCRKIKPSLEFSLGAHFVRIFCRNAIYSQNRERERERGRGRQLLEAKEEEKLRTGKGFYSCSV